MWLMFDKIVNKICKMLKIYIYILYNVLLIFLGVNINIIFLNRYYGVIF